VLGWYAIALTVHVVPWIEIVSPIATDCRNAA
jgi:hypothetical protein